MLHLKICLKIFLTLFLSLGPIANGANILFYYGLSSYSHRIAVWPLVEKLAEKNHSITFVMPYPPKQPHPKVKEFWPEELAKSANDVEKIDYLNLRLQKGQEATRAMALRLPERGLAVCEAFLGSTKTQEWIQNSNFDLIFIDSLMNECAYGLALRFKAKTILFAAGMPFQWWYDSFGIVPETSWIADLNIPFQYPMNFYQRLITTFGTLHRYYNKQHRYFPALGKLFQKTFALAEEPDVASLERETSLIFTNSHFSEELARSLPPLIVPVGGLHCEDKHQTLSGELKRFIEEGGSNGFAYVSFGTAAKISKAPKEFQEMFLHALGNSSLRFVWKYEEETGANIPPNVFIGKWLPQQAILAHPKIKAFFGHTGLLGIQEAVWYGVPLIALPVFAEQDFNALRIQRSERGVMIDPNRVTQEKISRAIHEVTTNAKYKKNMQVVSKLFKDLPAKPLDTALWWTEYVLRNDDLSSLKPLGIHQTWYERRLLDVWGFIFAILLLTFTAAVYFIKSMVLCLIRISGAKESNRNLQLRPASSGSESMAKKSSLRTSKRKAI